MSGHDELMKQILGAPGFFGHAELREAQEKQEDTLTAMLLAGNFQASVRFTRAVALDAAMQHKWCFEGENPSNGGINESEISLTLAESVGALIGVRTVMTV